MCMYVCMYIVMYAWAADADDDPPPLTYTYHTEGLSGILPVELLSLFTTGEVEAIVCGVPTVDISVLQKATEYEGVSPQDRHIQVGR